MKAGQGARIHPTVAGGGGIVAASLEARLVTTQNAPARVQIYEVVSSNLTIPNLHTKNGGSTVEEYGDTGRIFDNTENDN